MNPKTITKEKAMTPGHIRKDVSKLRQMKKYYVRIGHEKSINAVDKALHYYNEMNKTHQDIMANRPIRVDFYADSYQYREPLFFTVDGLFQYTILLSNIRRIIGEDVQKSPCSGMHETFWATLSFFHTSTMTYDEKFEARIKVNTSELKGGAF